MQESTWCWVTNENIRDFTTPSYTQRWSDVPMYDKAWGTQAKDVFVDGRHNSSTFWDVCMQGRQGWLHLVLGHKLLLLVWSRCCNKRGWGRGGCHTSVLLMDHLPACSPDTLECIICPGFRRHYISGTPHAWAVYNNFLVPGQSPQLSGVKSYGQVVQYLVEKVYKGLHCQIPVHTSAVFECTGRLRISGHCPTWMQPEQSVNKFQASPPTSGGIQHDVQDVREEFSMMQDIQESGKSMTKQPEDKVN